MKSSINRNRGFISVSLILILAFFTINTTFAGTPDPGIKSTIQFLDKANSTSDRNQVLAQIRSLKGQNYQEVYDLVKKQIVLDSHAAKLDAERMIAWIEVLTSISAKGETRFIGWLTREINANFRAHPDLKSVRLALKSATDTLKQQPEFVDHPTLRSVELEAAIALRNPANTGISDELLKTYMTTYNTEKYDLLRAATDRVLTQDIRQKQINHTLKPVIARETEINSAIDVLLRMKGKAPVILGDIGVGKTAIGEGIAEKLLKGDLPAGFHSEKLKNTIVLVTSPSKLEEIVPNSSSANLANALEYYLKTARNLSLATKTKLLVQIENAHELVQAQLDVLKDLLDTGNYPVVLIGNAKKAAFSLMADDQFVTRIAQIQVQELNEKSTFELLKKNAVPDLERNYQIKIPDEVVTAAIELSPDLSPELRRPDGPLKLLQDAAIHANRVSNGAAGILSTSMLYDLAAKKARLPVVPQDRVRFISIMDELRTKIKSDVRGQDATIDRIVDLFASTMTAKGKKSRAAVVVGTTGTGKSLIPSRLVHYFYGTHTRMLKIDGNQLKTDDSGFFLFGPKMGYIGSDKNKGLLANHFDGPGQGSSIVLIDELDKMHPAQVERLMEIIDTGMFTAGDGRARSTGRVLWLFTSNKGAQKFFPPEWVKNASLADVQARLQSISAGEIKEAFLQQESFAKSDEVLKPEVLARMDEMILVGPILRETALDIAKIKIRDEIEIYREQGLGEVKIDDGFVNSIVNQSYDPVYGVRELERNIKNQLARVFDAHVKRYGASKSMTISTLQPEPGTSFVRFQSTNDRGDVLTLEGPKLAYENPLFDPEEKKNLKNLEAALNSKVYGQTFYAKKLAESIQKNAVDVGSPKPVSIYALGMTGNGKTEMARALTQARFGSQEYLCKLEMGQVSSVKDLSNIFQSAVGYVGSDQPGQFERFLQRYKKGVILFDEMGNAGGNDKNAKEEIGKYLYSILDDGVWVSPVTKKTYYLKDYIFIFTGNEAEKIFAGNTQDDMLHAIWKQFSSEEKARDLLRQSGLSPAFVGRIGSAVLTEPPVTQTKVTIVKKLIGEWASRVEAKQPVKIIYDDSFVEMVSKLTYSSTEGARSVINFVNTTLGSTTSQGIFEIDFLSATLDNRAEVRLSLETKVPSHPFYDVKPDETLAKLIVSVNQNKSEVARIESDFTKSAKFIKQIRKVDAYATAFHEAGHAILNNPITAGRRLEHLTIIPADGYLGYARYEDLPGFKTNYTLTDLRARLATLVAGSEAELLVGREVNSGQSGDLMEERRLLTRAATHWGLVPELMGAKIDSEGNAIFNETQQKLFNKFAASELKIARDTARKFIVENWTLEYKVAQELMEKGEISGARFEEIKSEVAAMTPAARKAFAKEHAPEKVQVQLAELDKVTCDSLLRRP